MERMKLKKLKIFLLLIVLFVFNLDKISKNIYHATNIKNNDNKFRMLFIMLLNLKQKYPIYRI